MKSIGPSEITSRRPSISFGLTIRKNKTDTILVSNVYLADFKIKLFNITTLNLITI